MSYEGEEPPEFIDLSERKRRKPRGRIAAAICALGIIGYLMFWRIEVRAPQKPWPPGYAELINCSYATSLDGTKELKLLENKNAVLYDKSVMENGKYHKVDGQWVFDQAAQRYAVTLNGNTISYLLLDPKGFGACMLISGELGAANLNKSWFAPTNDDAADHGPSYEEAHEPH